MAGYHCGLNEPNVWLSSNTNIQSVENTHLCRIAPLQFTNYCLFSQDTIGPMVRSVSDAAIVLSIIAGPDPNDNFTLAQPTPVPDFTKALNANALKGKRIGVPRRVFLNDSITGNDPFINVAFEQALETIKELGATVVDPADLPSADEIVTSNNETVVLDTDFKVRFL